MKLPSLWLRHPRVSSALAFASGLGVVALVTAWQVRHSEDVAAARFEAVAQRAAEQVALRLNTYQYGLRGARGTVISAGAQPLDRERFHLYSRTRDIDREFPGARGMGLIWRVPAAAEKAFVEAARREGVPEFNVRQIAPHDGERYVIQYIEPVDRNREAIGLDIGSEANRRDAADRALRSGEATLSRPITLVQAAGNPRSGFLLLLPIYRPGAQTATPEQREAAGIGWAFAPLVIDEVLRDFDFQDGEFTLTLSDVAGPQPQVFFATADAAQPPARGLVRQMAIPVFGSAWQAEVRALPPFVKGLDQRNPHVLWWSGVAVSALLSYLIYLFAQSSQRALWARAEEARRAAIVDGSNDAIVGFDAEGRVIDWNPAAERLFGYTGREVLGAPLAALWLPEDRAGEDSRLRSMLLRGEAVPAFDTARRARDGRLIDVSISAAPLMGADGRFAGCFKIVRDITETQFAQRLVRDANRQLEAQVSERTALLEAARRDLANILDAVPSLIGYWDASLCNRFANKAYSAWFGIDAERVPGMSMSEVLGPRFETNRVQIEGALRGEPQRFERTYARYLPDGQAAGERHALTQYLPDVVDGEVRGFYALVTDISEQVRDKAWLAAALRHNEALLQTVHQHAIVSVADHQGRIVEANDRFCAISGYEREDLVGNDHRIVNSGVQPAAFWRDMWDTVSAGKPWRGDICNRAKDGSLYWVDSMIAPVLGADGRLDQCIAISTDITTAKLAEQRLRASESFLDRTGQLARVGGWTLDLATQHIQWTDETCRIHELPPGHTPTLEGAVHFYAPEARPRIQAALEQSIVTGSGWDLELPFITAKGRHIWVRAIGEVEHAEGKPVRLVGAFQDVTARKQADDLLTQTLERFSIAAESAGIGVWERDLVAGTLTWDEGMYRLYGQGPSTSREPFDIWRDALHPDDREAIEVLLRTAVREGSRYAPEFRIVHPDGDVRHIKANARVVRDAAGRALRMTGVNFDITERKRAEEALRGRERLMRMVIDSFPGPLAYWDRAERCTLANEAYRGWIGLSPEQMIGRSRSEIFGPDVAAQHQAGVQAALRGEAHQVPGARRDVSGRMRQFVLHFVPDQEGDAVRGFISVVIDVTELKQIQRQLQQRTLQAENASRAKSQFLANMSHEIRTPMNAVIGLAYLLGQTALDAEQTAFLGKIRLASKSLLTVINDILDFSKIEAGELAIERAVFSLPALLQELTDVMGPQAQAKRIGLRVDLPDGLPPALLGDEARLTQILNNVISNAIKFTDCGGVTLEVQLQEVSPRSVRLRFGVRDTGIGIDEAAQARLFAPFAQADSSTTRRFGGTGLGLSIVKRLATLMGGEVGVRSALGAGSEFWVVLPFEPAPADLLPAAAHAPGAKAGGRLAGLRVLVVDDSDINLEVARRILELEGAQVQLAAHGEQALTRLRAAPDAFDAVLMDVQMPVMDGREATRRIRAELGLSKLPVVALTAGALTSERERAIEAGMDDFVSKPFDPQALVACLRRHVGRLAPGIADPAGSAPLVTRSGDARWPEIDGIDGADVRSRLGNDAALFLSMLRRLLDESADLARTGSAVGVAGLSGDTPALESLRARMHKLRGTAGMLGARPLARLAAQTETACAAADGPTVAELLLQLGEALRALRAQAAPVLDASAQPPGAHARRGSSSEPIDPRAVTALLAQLQHQNLSAIDAFAGLAEPLRERLGQAAYDRLRAQVEGLQFMDAARTLAEAVA